MRLTTLCTLLTVFCNGSLWASSQNHFVRPEFTSIGNEQSEVAIGDTKISDDLMSDNGVAAAKTETAQASDVSQGETSKPDSKKLTPEFSVRLISYKSKKSIKASTKLVSKPKSMTVAQKASEGNYTIQLSSFLTEGEARAALEKFQKSNNSLTWMSTAEVKGVVRYRIYNGHYKTLKEARAAQSKVAADSGVKEAFVQKVFVKLTAENDLK